MERTVIECKKGCVDLFDYNVRKCVKLKQNYYVTYQGETMTLTPHQLLNEIVEKTPQISKFGKDYELWSYIWKPDKNEES